MGTEAAWVPMVASLVASAVGTGATIYNQRKTAREQDNQLASQIRNQSGKQRQADAQVQQLIGKEKTFSSAPTAAAEQQQIAKVQAANAPQATNVLQLPGGASKAYQRAGSDAALGVAKYGADQARLTAGMDAPVQARKDFQKNINDYNVNVGQIGRNLRGDDYLAQMKLASIHQNPWIGMGSTLLGGAARGYAGAMGAPDVGGGAGGAAAPWYMKPNMTGDLPSLGLDPWSQPQVDPYSYMAG